MSQSAVQSVLRSRVRSSIAVHKIQKCTLATVAPLTSFTNSGKGHKVVVVGGGAAGLAVGHQLLRSGKFAANDIAIIDPAEHHNYQPGWTLVGGGLKKKEDLQRSMQSLIDTKLKFYQEAVVGFQPDKNVVSLSNGDQITYDQLVVAPGIKISIDAIEGLSEALQDPDSMVSTIYSYDHCCKVFPTIKRFKQGNAIFTQPSGIVKCAGAPQKIMWLALDHWKQQGTYLPKQPLRSPINITFATALPVMFGVPKYSQRLNQLREERGVEAMFEHDLVSVKDKVATFKSANSKGLVQKPFDFLHAVPKMGPYPFIKDSVLGNEAGFVNVDETTLQHKEYSNVWSLGDAAALPTSKTAAAITAQTPVLVKNVLSNLEGSKKLTLYDGYTSCPLTTEYGKVMLAEFKYGSEPKETFGKLLGIDQATPRRSFYYMKKDFFPWVYYKSMVKGTWMGPKGWTS